MSKRPGASKAKMNALLEVSWDKESLEFGMESENQKYHPERNSPHCVREIKMTPQRHLGRWQMGNEQSYQTGFLVKQNQLRFTSLKWRLTDHGFWAGWK